MAEVDEERQVCDVAVTLAFSVLGKRWNGMIVSSLGGVHRPSSLCVGPSPESATPCSPTASPNSPRPDSWPARSTPARL